MPKKGSDEQLELPFEDEKEDSGVPFDESELEHFTKKPVKSQFMDLSDLDLERPDPRDLAAEMFLVQVHELLEYDSEQGPFGDQQDDDVHSRAVSLARLYMDAPDDGAFGSVQLMELKRLVRSV